MEIQFFFVEKMMRLWLTGIALPSMSSLIKFFWDAVAS
jgi:hypothetical protein